MIFLSDWLPLCSSFSSDFTLLYHCLPFTHSTSHSLCSSVSKCNGDGTGLTQPGLNYFLVIFSASPQPHHGYYLFFPYIGTFANINTCKYITMVPMSTVGFGRSIPFTGIRPYPVYGYAIYSSVFFLVFLGKCWI